KWWGVLARVAFDRNGNVLEKSLGIDDGRHHQGAAVEITVRENAGLFNPCEHPGVLGHLGYLPYRAMRTGTLVVDVSPGADPNLTHRAFDVHLDCLAGIRGCRTPGDIAPAAWHDSDFHYENYQEQFTNCSH